MFSPTRIIYSLQPDVRRWVKKKIFLTRLHICMCIKKCLRCLLSFELPPRAHLSSPRKNSEHCEKEKKSKSTTPPRTNFLPDRCRTLQRKRKNWTTTFQETTFLTNGWHSLRPTRVVVVVVVALAVVFLRRLQWYRAFGGTWQMTHDAGTANICGLKGRAPGGTDEIMITMRARNTAEPDRERERRRRK